MPHRLALAVLAALVLGPTAMAQQTGDDPRDILDPRDIPDPRDVPDPRDLVEDPREPAQGPELFDELLARNELGRLKEEMSMVAWELLPYIDRHCEGWLAIVERGEPASPVDVQEASDMQQKGRLLAHLADEGLGTSRFAAYVDNFYGWTPEQQASFREGQRLYREGVERFEQAADAGQAADALTPLQQAHDRARVLGDTWGQSMALAARGRLLAALERDDEALATMQQALSVGREIRDLDAVWEALSVMYELALRRGELPAARDLLQQQYDLAQEVEDPETSEEILTQLVQLEMVMKNENVTVILAPASETEP